MFSVVCAGCGELLDRGSTLCRVCGQHNNVEALELPPVDNLPVDVEVDRLQPWSAIKHEIIEKYVGAYTKILKEQRRFKYVYIDAFAGAGVAFDEEADDFVRAGAMRVLQAHPPFSEYHFIELNPAKAAALRQLTSTYSNVQVHTGDYIDILPGLLSGCRYEDFARAVCFLDPYGLSIDYALLKDIAQMKSVEIFFNFMLMSANRNVLWRNLAAISPERRRLMERVWGKGDWVDDVYTKEPDLFGGDIFRKNPNEQVVDAYRKRLKEAGFPYVPKPVAMRNRMNAPLYYLYFCGHNETGARIVDDIFAKYR